MKYIKREEDIHIVEYSNIFTLFKKKRLRLYECRNREYAIGYRKKFINADTGAIFGRCPTIEHELNKKI